ncbi:hypothetical protein KEJ15_05700 [Candidatus Bathyarchaeota archaeon]|nr:hypothetical protein [Candidatus Bathyarchaeota archaeon]
MASRISIVTSVVLKNLFLLTPLGSKPSSGKSLFSSSPCLTPSSSYSRMYVIVCCGTKVKYWCLALLNPLLTTSMAGTW